MDYTSYLIPESVKESCRDYISRLQKENKVYEDVKSRVNVFLIDESSQGEAITALKDRVSNYSAILATLILANEYDISDSYKFMNLVGDEIFDGSVILQAKQDAYDDWVEYGNNASDFRGKEKRATTQDEADSYRGQADNWDRMASEAKGSYDHFCKKEKKFDEIEEACSSLFLSSKELRENANNLLKFINSGTDLKANAEDYAKYRQDLTAGYYGSDRTYGGKTVSSSNGQKVDFSMFWKDNHDSNMLDDEKDGVLEELKAKKAAYQKALEETDDPHQKDFFRGLIAGIDDSIEEVNDREQLKELYERREAYQNAIDSESDPHQKDYFKGLIADIDEKIKELDKSKPLPGDDKVFIKTTYTSQKMAALYEEKAALEKAIEMDPSQKNYLQARIDILENNIKTWVDYGLDNAKHEEEFRFVYERMGELDYSEEEILKVITYWMHVDDRSNLLGKEMPPWWREEYLTIPEYLEVNEGNVVDCFYGEDKNAALFDYYKSTYLLCDAISGMGNNTKGGVPLSSSKVREMYTTNEKGDLFSCWFDYQYGGMYEYVEGIGTPRATKYALENHMDFPNQKSEYGVYQIYDNVDNDYFEFCKNAYLYKYNHASEFYNHVLNEEKATNDLYNYLLTSDNDYERLIYYIKNDLNKSAKTDFTYQERKLIEESYEAFIKGAPSCSKNICDMANLLQNDESIFALGQCDVNVDGMQVIVNATLINPAGYLDTSNDCYVMDFSDCCTYAFGTYYISRDDFIKKSYDFSVYRYYNGWIDPLVMEERKALADEKLKEQAKASGYSLDGLDEATMDLLRLNTLIMADSDNLLHTAFVPDRVSKIETVNESLDEIYLAMGAACALAAIFTPASVVEVLGFSLLAVDELRNIAQGDYAEALKDCAWITVGGTISIYASNLEKREAAELAKYIKEEEARIAAENARKAAKLANTANQNQNKKIVFESWEKFNEYQKLNEVNKPKGSPDIKKWFAKGGKIEISGTNSNTWKYTSAAGDSVDYIDGIIKYPKEYLFNIEGNFDFYLSEFTGNRGKDKRIFLKYLESYGLDDIPEGYILHHDYENGHYQLVRDYIHKIFTHYGGVYYNKIVK